MNRWLAHATWGLGALGLLVLAPGSAQAQEASANAAPEASAVRPARAADVAELILPGRGTLALRMDQARSSFNRTLTWHIGDVVYEGAITLMWPHGLQQRPDGIELRIRKARVTEVFDVGPGVRRHFLLAPLSTSPVEVELVPMPSAVPKGNAGDRVVDQAGKLLRWLQLDGDATFTWTNGVELRLHRAHATLASIPDEGYQTPRLLLVEPLRDSLAAR
jgi:hypothetical protein